MGMLLFILTLISWSQDFKGTAYINQSFTQLLVEPIKQTSALKTLKCNEKIHIESSINNKIQFYKIKAKNDWGYVEHSNVSKTKSTCFTQEYPEFFAKMVENGIIEGKDLYLWGELYNEMESANTKIYP